MEKEQLKDIEGNSIKEGIPVLIDGEQEPLVFERTMLGWRCSGDIHYAIGNSKVEAYRNWRSIGKSGQYYRHDNSLLARLMSRIVRVG